MTFSVTVRASTTTQPEAIVLTPRKGPAVALEASAAWELHKAIMNACLSLDHTKRETAIATKVRVAKRAERELRRPAKVDEQLRDREV